jgi:protein-disulfide isomerase
VAILGVIWFLAVLGLLLVERQASKPTRENVPGYLFALSTAGLAMVLYLGWGAFVVLKTVCVLCVVTYVSVIAIFLLSGSATSYPMTTLPGRILRDLRAAAASPLALVTLLLFAGGAASAVAFFPREAVPAAETAASTAPATASSAEVSPAASAQGQQSEVERWFDSQPRAIVPVDPAGAAVLIVKFNDYQCPPCRQTYEQYKPIIGRLQAQNPGKIKFVTRDFPIDPECNASTPNGMHQVACEAAVAVRLARQKGGDELATKLEDWLFANQPTLTQMGIRNAARDVAGVTDYDARYAGILEQVKADTALGALLGVRATPTFFINGVKIDGGLQPPFFETIVTAELKKNSK